MLKIVRLSAIYFDIVLMRKEVIELVNALRYFNVIKKATSTQLD